MFSMPVHACDSLAALTQGKGDDFHRGRAFEYVWHLIFGEPAETGSVHDCALYNCDGYRQLHRVAESGECETGQREGC